MVTRGSLRRYSKARVKLILVSDIEIGRMMGAWGFKGVRIIGQLKPVSQHDINAPEPSEPGGQEAKEALKELILNGYGENDHIHFVN